AQEPLSIFLYVYDSPERGVVGNLAQSLKSWLQSKAVLEPDFSMQRKFLEAFGKGTEMNSTDFGLFREKLLRIFHIRQTVNRKEFQERFNQTEEFYKALGEMTVGRNEAAGKAAFERDPFCALIYLSETEAEPFLKRR
ncbi:MAG TPA: hypothetical protein VGM34_03195, partial [Chlamydiales bacterium]